MKKPQIALFLGLAIVCVTICALILSQGTSHAQNNVNGASRSVSTTDPHTFGLPAITPHLLSKSAGSNGNSTGTATFTSEDVRNYVNTQHIPGTPLMGLKKPVITKIIFESSLEVSKRLNGENTGFPDETLLCYVEFRGTFTYVGPSGKTVTYQTGYEVFDAQTGNFVMSGSI